MTYPVARLALVCGRIVASAEACELNKAKLANNESGCRSEDGLFFMHTLCVVIRFNEEKKVRRCGRRFA